MYPLVEHQRQSQRSLYPVNELLLSYLHRAHIIAATVALGRP